MDDDEALDRIRRRVRDANKALAEHGLVKLTWGNVSEFDRARGWLAIKPSGVSFAALEADDIVVVALDGRTVAGDKRPSSDLPTHIALYRAFPDIGGVAHTHSTHATAFAQAGRELPCLGTTHADVFYGDVPLARALSRDEIEEDYEANLGESIVECFAKAKIEPMEMPAVLCAYHGPVTWGVDAAEAVENAVVLEECAQMAVLTLALNHEASPLPGAMLAKHHARKHGPDAYYGQR